ncbi:unnamed protein product [Cuscuta europaea]|uniref:Pre-rRNA-processing protein RIX1 N-terminal domain-containing protein n=1 Tax=Cuscuta europaea TaxID=41803 RepID=A0A9P1EJF9_CUSEU|nr:unnamed protein product [Cuscuta europaea]
MAACDHIQGMYDFALKPQLLRSLLNEYVPTERHPFRSPSDLSHVVSVVKTHRLLSESAPSSIDQKIIENWKSVVDDWSKRFQNLASSNKPDKCWAGICLLGVTCQECSSERFLASYPSWFIKLLSHIQSPADSHLVKAASCASISDLFTRLSGFSNAKKDGTSQVIQPVLKFLIEDTSVVVWEEAISLFCTLINVFPSSVHRFYDEVESAVVSKFMSGKCSQSLLKKLGECLVLLPKSKGDADTWLLMMQKILLSVNNQLRDAFQGLEPETRHNQAMRLLLPPGKDAPPPLGGQGMTRKSSSESMNRSEHLLMTRISILMRCCSMMLTSSYSVQVAVPVCALVDLTKRVLMVDGSASGLYAFMTTSKQELILSELPLLHLCSLELIITLVKELHSQLLPHAAGIVRLLIDYFERCALPELRIKLYSVVKVLLLSMGVGISAHLAQAVIDNASMDLAEESMPLNDHAKMHADVQLRTSKKKRKHADSMASQEDQPDGKVTEVKNPRDPTLISWKIAALEALEALLTVGGSWKSGDWRSKVDDLIMTVATSACQVKFSQEESSLSLHGTPTSNWTELQLAALHALLASLLSSRLIRLPEMPQCLIPARPPHLSCGLDLFRKGVQETETRLSHFCAHALLTLEVLVHPRALPLLDHRSTVDYDGSRYQRFTDLRQSGGGVRQEVHSNIHEMSKTGQDELVVSEYDELHERWMRIDDDATEEAPSPSDVTMDNKSNNTKELSVSLNNDLLCLKSAAEVTDDQKHGEEPIKKQPVRNIDNARSGALVLMETDTELPNNNLSLMEGVDTELPNNKLSLMEGVDTELPNNNLSLMEGGGASILNKIASPSISSLDSGGKGFMQERDDSDEDSIPDIVDVEPDDADTDTDPDDADADD